jgi:replication factor C subunit 1
MFTTIYRPKNINNFIGNKEIIQPFIKWLLLWDENDIKNKGMLISGLTGIGKTLLVELLLKKHDYNIVNLTLEDDRNKDYMNEVIKPLIKTKKTFNGQDNVLIVSDIDASVDYGLISSITECFKDTKIPIICICDNRYDQAIKPILNYCFDIRMSKPTYKEVYVLIYKVIVTEKIKIKETEIKELYEQSNGDIRFILNNLQFGMTNSSSTKKNIQSANIFETTGTLFSMDETIHSKYDTYWLSNDLHLLMVQENYINNTFGVINQVKKMENISYSSDVLSDADLFQTQVNLANWEFEPYVAITTIDATSKCNKKAMIKFPQILGRISTMYKNKSALAKSGSKNNNPMFNKLTQEVKVKEVKVKEVKEVKEVKVKEKKEKKVKEIKEKKVKEIKEVKVKEVKVKEVKVKEVKEKKVKEVKVKEVKVKEVKEKKVKEKKVKEVKA